MSENNSNYFTHTVLFWMNEPDNEEHKVQLEAGLKELIMTSEYSKLGHVGIPAGTPRDVVDSTYQFSLLTIFESAEDQDKYQTEPAHLTFIDKCKHTWSKVLIYDSVSV